MCGVVTGPARYMYLKVADNFSSAEVLATELQVSLNYEVAPVQGVMGISNNYTCHTWSLDTGRLLIGTDMGDLLLVNFDGTFH